MILYNEIEKCIIYYCQMKRTKNKQNKRKFTKRKQEKVAGKTVWCLMGSHRLMTKDCSGYGSTLTHTYKHTLAEKNLEIFVKKNKRLITKKKKNKMIGKKY